jgi:hypothetical protein
LPGQRHEDRKAVINNIKNALCPWWLRGIF